MMLYRQIENDVTAMPTDSLLQIQAIKAFNDNYIWLASNNHARALVVDPGDAAPVLARLDELELTLEAILVTHHHFDHTGGIEKLVSLTGAKVFGPLDSPFKNSDHELNEGQKISVLGTSFEIIEVPGHTLDHIAYVQQEQNLLFCGDTLFAGGCGRIFEGNPKQMFDSLEKLANLHPDTLVYCAHEYTLSNLHFAVAVEPNNSQLLQRLSDDQDKRDKALATVPSTIALELATNPFLRCQQPDVVSAAQKKAGAKVNPGAEALSHIRAWKDNF